MSVLYSFIAEVYFLFDYGSTPGLQYSTEGKYITIHCKKDWYLVVNLRTEYKLILS